MSQEPQAAIASASGGRGPSQAVKAEEPKIELSPHMKIWIVVKYWPGGKRENAAAYTTEENARLYASRLVGADAMIALETIDVDKPELNN